MNFIILGVVIASFVYGLYQQSKLRSGVQPGKIQGPTASDGQPIPVVFGTKTITAPNVLWWGDTEIRKRSDGSSQYWAGLHFGLCHGQVDKLLDVTYADTVSSLQWATLGAGDDVGQAEVGFLWDAHSPEPANGDRLYGSCNICYGKTSDGTTDDGSVRNEMGDYLAGAQGTSYVPKYRGIASFVAKHCLTGTSPYIKPWSFTVRRIATRHGGQSAQWYPEKSSISFGRNREDDWKFLLQDTSDSADYSAAEYDDSGWDEAPGGIGNAPMNLVVTEYGSDYDMPVVKTNLSHAAYPTLVLADYPSEQVKAGIKIWMRTDLGPLPPGPLGVRFWHDDSAKLWFNGTAVSLTAMTDSNGAASKYQSTAIVPASLISSTGPNIVAYRVLDTYSPTGATIGTNKYIYGGIQVGSGTDNPAGTVDMNPAHIIWEVLTDAIWGMGYADADLDDTAFSAAADTLYSERLGLSLLWDQQSSIEDFIQEVLRHINGVLYIDRTTGLFVLKLIRADYDPEELLVLDESCVSKIENATRKAVGELVNSVTATYSSSLRGDTGSATVYDAGLLQAQGGIVSAKVDYPGVTQQFNASRLAFRDLRVMSSPLLTCEVHAARQAAVLNPGDAFVLDWPDLEIDELVMRVTAIDLGNGVETGVKVTCVEDVFSMSSLAPTGSNPPATVGSLGSIPSTGNLILNPNAETALGDEWWGAPPGDIASYLGLAGAPFYLETPNSEIYGVNGFYYLNMTGGHSELSQLIDVSAYAAAIDAETCNISASATFIYAHHILTQPAGVQIGFYASTADANDDRSVEEWTHDLGTCPLYPEEGAGPGITVETLEDHYPTPYVVPIGTRVIMVRMKWWNGVGGDITLIDNLDLHLLLPTAGIVRDPTAVQTSPGATGSGTTNPWAQTSPPDPSVQTVSSSFSDATIDANGMLLATGSNLKVTSASSVWTSMTTDGYSIGDERTVVFACEAAALGMQSVGAGLAALDFVDEQDRPSITKKMTFRFKLLEDDTLTTVWRMT